MNPARIVLSLGLLGLCVLFRQTLEADPASHVLVQLPLLAISGGLFVAGSGAGAIVPSPALGAPPCRLQAPGAYRCVRLICGWRRGIK